MVNTTLLPVNGHHCANEGAGVFDAVEAVSHLPRSLRAGRARDELVHGVLSKGNAVSIRLYITQPKAHQSTSQPYASPRSISGAM